MGAQIWTYTLLMYFLVLASFLGTLTQGEVLQNTNVRYVVNDEIRSTEYNETYSTDSPSSTNPWSFGEYISVLFGFFVWGIDLGIGNWMWLVRLFFVYFPLTALLLSIYYSLPTVSG